MKFTLRDLFWLQIFAAIAVCWGWEHSHLSVVLKKQSSPDRFLTFSSVASNHVEEMYQLARARTALLHELQSLSNDDLKKRAAKVINGRQGSYGDSKEFNCCLSELARRKKYDQLESLYENSKENNKARGYWFPNAVLLTALRRAQGHPDPLKIHVDVLSSYLEGNAITHPEVIATVQNVDTLKEPFVYQSQSDGYSRPCGRWHIRLTDEKGRIVKDTDFFGSGFVNGAGVVGELATGERSNRRVSLDLRSFFKRPPAGLYTLEVIHSDGYMAYDPNLDDQIVWTSDPIQVRVESAGPSGSPISAFPLLFIGLIAGVVLVLNHFRMNHLKKMAGRSEPANTCIRRDLIFLGVIMILVLGWLGDSHYLKAEISRRQLDQPNDWTIRVP